MIYLLLFLLLPVAFLAGWFFGSATVANSLADDALVLEAHWVDLEHERDALNQEWRDMRSQVEEADMRVAAAISALQANRMAPRVAQ